MGLGRVLPPTPARPGCGRTPKSVQLCREAEAAAACLTPVHLSVFVSLVSSRSSLAFFFFCKRIFSALVFPSCPSGCLPSVPYTLSTLQICPKPLGLSLHLSWLPRSVTSSPGIILAATPDSSFLDSLFTPSPCSLPVTLSPSACLLVYIGGSSLPLSLPIVEGVHGLEMSHPHWLTI